MNGVTVYDDFAHHPTAVAETIAAVRAGHPGRRVWAVFEPRSASSCRRVFQDDFARAFVGGRRDRARPRLPIDAAGGSAAVGRPARLRPALGAGRSARHIDTMDAIIDTIVREHADGDVVLIMSNGGFGGIHRKLVHALQHVQR